jgi:hypothetical protein
MQLVRFPMRFTDAYIACWVLREEGGAARDPTLHGPGPSCRRRIYDLWPFLHYLWYTVLFGDRMYCFCGGVTSFNVFCVLVTYPPGRRPGGEFLAVQGTATELWLLAWDSAPALRAAES